MINNTLTGIPDMLLWQGVDLPPRVTNARLACPVQDLCRLLGAMRAAFQLFATCMFRRLRAVLGAVCWGHHPMRCLARNVTSSSPHALQPARRQHPDWAAARKLWPARCVASLEIFVSAAAERYAPHSNHFSEAFLNGAMQVFEQQLH